MATNPTSTGPFSWVGPGTPPDNINYKDHLSSDKINEIKDNADFLKDNTEACFNEKINLYSDRDTLRRDIRYEDQYALRRDNVNTILDTVDRGTYLAQVWNTANTGRKDVAQIVKHYIRYDNRCIRRCGWMCANNKQSRELTDNTPHYTSVGEGCGTHYATYHSGVNNTDRQIRDTSEYLTFNSAHDGDDHSARHNIFCSILT